MPSNRKRIRRPSTTEPWKTEYMLTGRVKRPGTTDSPKPFMWGQECFANTYPAMWEEMKAELLPEWIREHPGTRPFAWWECDAPEAYREDETELDYLKRHELLTEIEQKMMKTQP